MSTSVRAQHQHLEIRQLFLIGKFETNKVLKKRPQQLKINPSAKCLINSYPILGGFMDLLIALHEIPQNMVYGYISNSLQKNL